MAKLSLPYTIENGDAVDAGPVEGNYQTIQLFSNSEVIERGGTVAMTAQLKLVGNPVGALDAAPKQYVDQILPIGAITMFAGAAAPVGGVWLLCDGTEYQETTYPDLAKVIGATSGRFTVPNLVQRMPMGTGTGYAMGASGGSPDAAQVAHAHRIDHAHDYANTTPESADHAHLGADHLHGVSIVSDTQGNHTHTVLLGQFLNATQSNVTSHMQAGASNQLPISLNPTTDAAGAHAHNINGQTGAADRALWTGGVNTAHVHGYSAPAMTGSTDTVGVAAAGANLPPYFVVNFIVRAK